MDALQQLRDLHFPPPPVWWPPAPGWWLLLVALLATIGWLARFLWARRQRRAPFRDARAELERLLAARRRGVLDAAAFADAANGLLKRLHIHALERPDLAALPSAGWLETIEAHLPDESLRRTARTAFGSERYRRGFHIDDDAIEDVTRSLIQRLESAA